jgi:hypothetical protein
LRVTFRNLGESFPKGGEARETDGKREVRARDLEGVGCGGGTSKSVPSAEVNASRVEAPVKLNCRRTLFLFLSRANTLSMSRVSFVHLSFSLVRVVALYPVRLPVQSSCSPVLSPVLFSFILSLFAMFAQLTRVSICFIKLRRLCLRPPSLYPSPHLSHGRDEIRPTFARSVNPRSSFIRCHSRRFSFETDKRGKHREGPPPLRLFGP